MIKKGGGEGVYDRYGNRALLNTSGMHVPDDTLSPQVAVNGEVGVMSLFPSSRWTTSGVKHDAVGNQTELPARTMAYDDDVRL